MSDKKHVCRFAGNGIVMTNFEVCPNGDHFAPLVWSQAELNDAVQAAHDEERSIGPCGKHPKACYVDPEKIVSVGNGEITRGYCSICAASTSPCGQKFSDGTPHPASCWRSAECALIQPVWTNGVCLICQSEEKLRGEREQWKMFNRLKETENRDLLNELARLQTHISALENAANEQIETELATLREGLQGLVEKWRKLQHNRTVKNASINARLRAGETITVKATTEGHVESDLISCASDLASLLAPHPTARDERKRFGLKATDL